LMTRKARKPASEARPNTSADRLRVKSVAILMRSSTVCWRRSRDRRGRRVSAV
jgi:hypothetical protein